MKPTPEELARALGRLPPRDAAWLRRRYVDGEGLQGCARAFGVAEQTVPLHTLRAARLLLAALSSAAPGSAEGDRPGREPPVTPRDAPPLSDAEESQLAARLEAGTEPTLCPPLRALAGHARDIRRLEAAWEEAAQASPERRRQDWLRRGALLGLVALALWLYLRGE